MFLSDDYSQLYFTSTRNEAQGSDLNGVTGTKDVYKRQGDATMTFPAQQISFATARQIKKISRAIAKELNISGPCLLYTSKSEKVIETFDELFKDYDYIVAPSAS